VGGHVTGKYPGPQRPETKCLNRDVPRLVDFVLTSSTSMGTSAAAAAARAHAAIQDDIVSNAPTFFRQACKTPRRPAA
jgi:hypothetical protein